MQESVPFLMRGFYDYRLVSLSVLIAICAAFAALDLRISDDFGRLDPDSETAIFRLVQESLTNIHRHSGSRVATIPIFRSGGSVCVEVRDAGKGIPPERRAEMEATGNAGVGIRGMRERMRQLGGALEISSSDNGTLVSARLPI